jgi:hypothetical protein
MREIETTAQQNTRTAAWRKLGGGLLLLFLAIKIQFFPYPKLPDAFKASQPDQMFVGNALSVVLCGFAVWLIFSGVRSFWPKPSE